MSNMGIHHHRVLSNAYSREHLMTHGKANGVCWEEHNHEGVNWMRFSNALIKHLDEGKEFHIDDGDVKSLSAELDGYVHMRELHKRSMLPHVRAAIYKIHSDMGSPSDVHPTELLGQAYKHLEANGGHDWASKVSTLNNINGHINRLTKRIATLSELSKKE